VFHPKIVANSRERLERYLKMPLREYSWAEVEEMAYRMKDVEWGEPGKESEVIVSLDEEIQAYILNEIQMSRIDFNYWLNRYSKILDDRGNIVPIRPWPSQQKLLNLVANLELKAWDRWDPKGGPLECKIPIIMLKSRQVGGTVIAESLILHMVMFAARARSVVGSDHEDNTLKLFQLVNRLYDHLPRWMRPMRDSKIKGENLHFNQLDSDIVFGSGNQKTTLGQGMTVDAFHLTELSTWLPENARKIDADLKPAFFSSRKHHSFGMFESTAEGGKGNWFHDQWEASTKNKSMFHPLFVGWFLCPEKWRLPSEGVEFDEETKAIAARIERENKVQLTRDQMAWWQLTREDFKTRDQLEIFYQEFPSTPEEAFQSGFRSVFSLETRRAIRDRCELPIRVLEWNSPLREWDVLGDPESWMLSPAKDKYDDKLIIWENPRPGYIYVIGVDSSYGVTGGDNSAVEVLRVGNRWDDHEQVAEWSGKISPVELAVLCEKVGRYYAEGDWPAKLAVECNPGNPGMVTQAELLRSGYPHFYVWRKPTATKGGWRNEIGFWTTPGTRNLVIDKGVNAVKKGHIRINSPAFVAEMDSFVLKTTEGGNRKVEHAPNMHDDRIMALFIALYVAEESDSGAQAEERLKAEELRNRPREEIVEYATLGMSWDQVMKDFHSRIS
jgi:hypothetical protein